MLYVEVKGYPSTTYARGPRAGRRKPTPPATQAREWFAAAFFKAASLRMEHPSASVMIALPDKKTYRTQLERLVLAFRLLRIGVFSVTERGRVARYRPGSIAKSVTKCDDMLK